ncbi:exonuclease mut-7 homolog isoform X1 [Archocentrus centrarchus]|uniref:exonuclease mut-7 homolog isoform X1 n=1 Tax=Archocentrus centrarchus TaxID=63155 RepID=UPI0011EA2D71|nr:exonuclease mut-7 homolog isoform X1 [Archocentrus centrarchus]XP_030597908.1 exonuclease mut-7 homolog isoform X1 [Archocentrus centrarchus]
MTEMSHTTPEAAGLDPAMLRDQLFELWSRKDLQMLHLAALQGFSKLSEPLEALLTILESCPGKQRGRSHTLGHQILMEFQTWIKEHPQVNLRSLSEQRAVALQRRALNLLTDTQPNFVDSLINIYQLNSLDPALLKLHITGLQAHSCYKEAAWLSIKLKLQEELNMEEMCVPLIMQDKLSVAESFVSGHSHLEQRLVTLLDSWCHPSFSVEELSKRFPRLSLTRQRMGHIQPKMLTKHVLRLMEKFKVDKGLCPNALHKRRLDSLRFLMYKRFVEKGMTEENWSDHVQYVVADDAELQIHLVEMLVKYSGLRKASQWSLRYKIPKDRLPCGVWETQRSLPRTLQQICLSDTTETEEWELSQSHCEKFYQVPLTKDKVHFVDTPEALEKCQHIVLKEGGIVGVDMEWQPTFGCISVQKVALIQLAVSDQVFLIDLCAGRFCEHPETVSFIRRLFSKQSVLKLGYGMAGDLKCLLATWPQLQEDPLKMDGMLDLLSIHKKIQQGTLSRTQNGPKEVLVGEDCAEKGLSLLVQQVLGRPLDKTEQMSNWEKRPLRISQIRYAVADAYCLLDVYSVLSQNPASFGLPADLHSISSSQSEMSRDKKLKEKQGKQTKQALDKEECQGAQRVSPPRSEPEKGVLYGREPAEDSPPLPPQQLRVVCDNMLQGLGRYLRCLGVDVVMLENTDDHRVAAKLAQAEGRVILTCGQPFQTLRSQVAEGRCFSLDCSEKARDQAVRVLKHFNVQPTPSDIFSRCQACNSDQYVAVPQGDMVKMLKKKGFLPDQDNTDLMHQQEEKHDDILTSKLPRYALQCRWASLSGLDPDTLTFPGGAPIQLHTVAPTLLPRIALFYVCTRCGKVFWEGSHFGRVLNMFQEVLHITDKDDESAAVFVTTSQQN